MYLTNFLVIRQKNIILTLYISSEEALEHCNKTVKDVEVNHARQIGHKERNLDTCHYLLDRSDPQVLDSCESPAQNRSSDPYPPMVKSWCKDDQTGEINAADFPGFFE